MSAPGGKTVRLPDGASVPALGQGTWYMGEGHSDRKQEAAALRLGLDLGMRLIDTAEMYADGGAEEVVADAIAGRRDEVFLVSKVYPHNAGRRKLTAACEASLARLRTDVIDLYLLHWRGSVPLAETVEEFEKLREAGKIRRWGVSNLDVDDLQELDDPRCTANQVLYNPQARGIEFDLLPWCAKAGMPLMAYSPIGQAGDLLQSRAMKAVAKRLDATPAQVAIAWSLRHPGVISIPKAATAAHVNANAQAASLILSVDDLAAIDAEYPPPRRKQGLAML